LTCGSKFTPANRSQFYCSKFCSNKKTSEINRERIQKQQKLWRGKNPIATRISSRKYHLKIKFNLTEKQYDSLLKKQAGCCAICKAAPEFKQDKLNRTRGRLNIDHNHETKKIRGLLCESCNRALGLFKDNPQILLNAFKYLIDDKAISPKEAIERFINYV